MAHVVVLHARKSRVAQATLSLIFDNEMKVKGQYLTPEQAQLKQTFVQSLERLNDDLQYCIISEINRGVKGYNPKWNQYLIAWFDKLATDIAQYLHHVIGADKINEMEAQVNKRIQSFIRVMFVGRVFYPGVKFSFK